MGQAKLRRQAMGSLYGKPPEVVWHYTAAAFIRPISTEGLRSAFKNDGIVWFTRSQTIDPTSAYALSAEMMATQSALGYGELFAPWRVGVHSAITEWFPDAVKQRPELYALTQSLHGANPRHWHLSGELLPEQLECYQRWDGGQWVSANPEEVAHLETPSTIHCPETATRQEREQAAMDHMTKTGQKALIMGDGTPALSSSFVEENPGWLEDMIQLHEELGIDVRMRLMTRTGETIHVTIPVGREAA